MKSDRSFNSAFRRAAAFFPSPEVIVESASGALRPASFCVVSFDPTLVALTLPKAASADPGKEFAVSTQAGATLYCTLQEIKETGDHLLLLAAVERIKVDAGCPPTARWRGASFTLKLDYPFLHDSATLEKFVDDWHTCVLPKSAWTHAAHVAVTGYHAFQSDAATVLETMKRGIRRFNESTGGVNGPDSGYHETLTRFWSDTITRAVCGAAPRTRLDAATYAVRIFGEDRAFFTLFYSWDVVRDRRARAEWISPDMEPAPEWCGA